MTYDVTAPQSRAKAIATFYGFKPSGRGKSEQLWLQIVLRNRVLCVLVLPVN